MSVSVSTSYSPSTRRAISQSMNDASIAAAKMSTGEAIIHAGEAPTSLAIGSNLRADFKTLEIVSTGIKQTKSMLYIAEQGMRAIYDRLTQMTQVLAQSKLGYMTPQLISTTLSPTYQQLKAECNRIAGDINFNGQKLLNGTGGKQNTATSSHAASTPTYEFNNDVSSALLSAAGFAFTALDVKASFGGAASASATLIDGSSAAAQIIGGTYSEASNIITITGATLIFNNVTIADGASVSAATNAATATVTMNDVTITLGATGKTATFADGAFSANTDTTSSLTIVPNASTSKTTVTNIDIVKGTVISPTVNTASSGVVGSGATAAKLTATVNNVDRYYPLTGGVNASSTFNFVSGVDLNHSVVKVVFPNLRLTEANGIPGLLQTIETQYNTISAKPVDLTSLTSAADADIDIPLVKALSDKLIAYLDELGAYQLRLDNIDVQVDTSLEQTDLAQGAIMNADLPSETEKFTRASVKVEIAVAVLSQLNNFLKSLARIVA